MVAGQLQQQQQVVVVVERAAAGRVAVQSQVGGCGTLEHDHLVSSWTASSASSDGYCALQLVVVA